MSSISDEYQQAIQLYNAGDLERLVNLFSEDAVLVTPYGTAHGPTAIREQLSRDITAFPERTVTTDVVVEQGDTIVSEWTFVATNTGPLVLPVAGTEPPPTGTRVEPVQGESLGVENRGGTQVPPTGKRVEVKGMELLQMRDGKIALYHMYYDNLAIAGQLGMLPGSAAN